MLARGVFHKVYDEDIVKDAKEIPMRMAFEAFLNYIRDRRTINSETWTQMERLVSKWQNERMRKEPRGGTAI